MSKARNKNTSRNGKEHCDQSWASSAKLESRRSWTSCV